MCGWGVCQSYILPCRFNSYNDKMFLALTANQEIWDKSQKILFLGEWCKLYSQREVLENLEYETLPDCSSDFDDFEDVLSYIDEIYERNLTLLADELNRLHSVNHSKEYWRKVVGPWLRIFTETLYERYLIIKNAERSNKVTSTILRKFNYESAVPFDLNDLVYRIYTDNYNEYLFGRIIREINPFTYFETDSIVKIDNFFKPINGLSGSPTESNRYKKIFNKILDIYSLHIPLQFNSILLCQTYMSNWDLISLALKLRQLPLNINIIPYHCNNNYISKNLRSNIHISTKNCDEFERLLSRLIPEQIPRCFVENYAEISQSIKKIDENANVIFLTNGIFDIGLSFLSADICESGGRLIETQHGGHFGSGAYNLQEELQKKTSDIFLSWGWSDAQKKVFPMSTGTKFNYVKAIAKERATKERNNILLIEYLFPRYYYTTLLYVSISSNYLQYINEQHVFYSSLTNATKLQVKVRFPEVPDYGWDIKQRWLDRFPEVDLNSSGLSLYDQLKESKLAIVTMNQTTILECLVGNIPTIAFWNPNIEKLRPSAQPYFDKLHEVGILHYTPQSAAKLVNEIYEDPMKWWMQPEIQQAKDEFCYQFARTSDDWMDQLAAVLKEQLALAKKEMKAKSKK